MRMSFDLDGCHAIEITGNVPRVQHDPASVCINVLYTPLPMPPARTENEPEGDYIQLPTQTKLSVSLKPSHARAIASALLSAATEARNG
jgi:hypothetical protein